MNDGGRRLSCYSVFALIKTAFNIVPHKLRGNSNSTIRLFAVDTAKAVDLNAWRTSAPLARLGVKTNITDAPDSIRWHFIDRK